MMNTNHASEWQPLSAAECNEIDGGFLTAPVVVVTDLDLVTVGAHTGVWWGLNVHGGIWLPQH